MNYEVLIIKIPIIVVEISVPITANVTISKKLWKNACLLTKYVESKIITGTNTYKNMSGEKVNND